MSAITQEQVTAKGGKYDRFFWPVLRGIALIVAMSAFIPYLSILLYGGGFWPTLPIFAVASFALLAMTRWRETPPAIEGERTGTAFWHPVPSSLFAYGVMTGLGENWVCAVLWFSRRYDVFSVPVVGAVVLILAFYAVMGVVVAWLTDGKWRTALLVFLLAPSVLSGIVLRLHLLR